MWLTYDGNDQIWANMRNVSYFLYEEDLGVTVRFVCGKSFLLDERLADIERKISFYNLES